MRRPPYRGRFGVVAAFEAPGSDQSPAQMPDLIAIAYAEDTIAAQAAAELERRAYDLPIDLDAVGVIVCERDGSCQLTTSCHRGATAGWSKFWGGLLGVVMGDVEVRGIDSSF